MKKSFKDDPDIVGLIDKLQHRLSAMEEKLDILISQSSKRPSRRFDHPQRHDRGRGDNGYMEKTYTRATCAQCSKECEIPFKPRGDRPVYCSECFSRRKKGALFNANRRDNRPGERDFSRGFRPNKKRGEKRQGPAKKAKPFFGRGKKRG